MSYIPATMSLAPAVIDMLTANFFRDEPINNALNLIGEKQFLEQFVLECMEEEMSIVAVDNNTERLLGEVTVCKNDPS